MITIAMCATMKYSCRWFYLFLYILVFVYGLGLIGAINQCRCLCNLLFLRFYGNGNFEERRKSLQQWVGGGGTLVTREIMQRKDAMQFYEITSLCANVLLPSTLLQFSTRKTLTGGSKLGVALTDDGYFWRLTVTPYWDYPTTSKIAPPSSHQR